MLGEVLRNPYGHSEQSYAEALLKALLEQKLIFLVSTLTQSFPDRQDPGLINLKPCDLKGSCPQVSRSQPRPLLFLARPV